MCAAGAAACAVVCSRAKQYRPEPRHVPKQDPRRRAARLDRPDRRRRGQGERSRASCSASSTLSRRRATPTSSSSRPPASCADTGARYEQLFRELGAGRGHRRSTSTRAATAERARLARAPRARPPASSSPAATSCGSRRILGGTPVAQADPPRATRTACTSAAPAPAPHPQRAHDRVRRGGRDRRIAGSVRLAPGPRPDQPLHHRPALPPARPPRPPAHRARLQPVRGRHRPRRGHRRVHRPGRQRSKSTAAARVTIVDASASSVLVDGRSADEGEPVCMTRRAACTSSSPARTFNLHTRSASAGSLRGRPTTSRSRRMRILERSRLSSAPSCTRTSR